MDIMIPAEELNECGKNSTITYNAGDRLIITGSEQLKDWDAIASIGHRLWKPYHLVFMNGQELSPTTRRSDPGKMLSLKAPDMVEIVGHAFDYCYDLASIDAPKVRKIGEGAFKDCISLTEVVFPEVEELGEEAFAGC